MTERRRFDTAPEMTRMTDDIRTLATRLSEDEAAARAAVKKLATISDDRPDACVPVVEELVTALGWDDESIRVPASYTLFNVSVTAPESLVDYADGMAAVLSDVGRQTRINLGRPLAEVAFVDPVVGMDVADELFEPFADGHDHYRHSAAWAMEAIAPVSPDLVRDHLDRIYPWFDDDYDPVAKHLARTLAMTTRSVDGTPLVTTDRHRETVTRLESLLDKKERVGDAAALALGAIGSSRATEVLSRRLPGPGDSSVGPEHGVLRVAYRDAVSDSPVATGTIDDPEVALANGRFAVGDWIGFTNVGLVPPGGALFGRIEAMDGAGGSAPTLTLCNPLLQYWAQVRLDIEQARYADPWRTRDIPFRTEAPFRVDSTRTLVSMLAPSDVIQVELDGHGTSRYRVIDVAQGDGDHSPSRMTVATEVDGPHDLTFYPESDPGIAVYDRGLAFDVTAASLENAPSSDVCVPPTDFDPLPLR